MTRGATDRIPTTRLDAHRRYAADSRGAANARYHLTRFVGHPAAPEPDVLSLALRPGDVLAVCTEGVTDQVGYPRLAQTLAQVPAAGPNRGGDPALAVAALLADARSAGGRDNATAVVVRVDAAASSPPATGSARATSR